MGILESLIVTCLTKKVCDYITEPKQRKPSFSERFAANSLRIGPEELLRKINMRIPEIHHPLSVEDFKKNHTNEAKAKCVSEFLALPPDDQNKILQFYSRIGNYSAWRVRLDLIQFLLTLDDGSYGCAWHLIHNELLYMINQFSPIGEQQVMLQKVCCFLDAEYFFLQGDFVSALKRLYDTINWYKVISNPWMLDRTDGNGLENLLRGALSNIINIYALLGLADKADETRRAFGAFFRQNAEENQSLDSARDEYGSNSYYDQYRDAEKKAVLANNKFVGIYSLQTESMFDNMFDNFVLCVVNGTVFYNINPAIYHEFGVEEVDGRQMLRIKGYGIIDDYTSKIEHAKAEINRKLYVGGVC